MARAFIKLWSVQEAEVWDELRDKRRLYVHPERVDNDFRLAYDWMRSRMSCMIDGYRCHYPWWAWRRPKPRIPNRAGNDGEPFVRLELRVPATAVVLSDYITWHLVLGRSYVPLEFGEDQVWEASLASAGVDPRDWPLPEPWHSTLLSSWDRIFDLEALSASGLWSVRQVQATFEILDLDHVTGVTEFLA